MSFLSNNNSEFLSARITQKGRNSIAKGDFNISYFQVGDSEFDYRTPFAELTGLNGTMHQKVFSPLDKDGGVKYPYHIDSSNTSTTYGIPIQNSMIETVRNVMGPAGFVTEHRDYDSSDCTGTVIQCMTDQVSMSEIDGTKSIDVLDGTEFQTCNFITLVFDRFCGTDVNSPVISGQTNSLIYKIVSISGNTLNLDRSTPNLSSISGYAQVVCNSCENEYPSQNEVSPVCLPNPIDPQQQLNSWTLNVIWDNKPIGANALDESLTGYESNAFASTKEVLGYHSNNGQTFTNLAGTVITKPTYFVNSFGEHIEVLPDEQRTIALIHYSELGDLRNDPERFFKYDDYIGHDNGDLTPLAIGRNDEDLSDSEYFEVYIPFINYHRSTGTTLGAIFTMDTTDYYVKSTKNSRHQIKFRYLLDEVGNKVGKVFVNNKVIVFDDQELVVMLDYRSNRRYTLPSPKLSTVHSDVSASNSLLSGTTGSTIWVTYMFQYTGDTQLNGIPCNYFNKIRLGDDGEVCSPVIPSNVTMQFTGNTFANMVTSLSGVVDGFIADKFYALVQRVPTGLHPDSHDWKMIDLTSSIPNHTVGNKINPVNLRNYRFTLTGVAYDAAPFYDLEDYIKNSSSDADYLGFTGSTTQPQFGDEQPFPGSIRLVRATDIERMNFLVNLPNTQFNTTSNPTKYNSDGSEKVGDRRITDIALLNDNKEVLVVAKTTVPIKRNGTQVFAVKLDF